MRRVTASALALIFVGAMGASSPAAAKRVVAIGDVHGSFDEFTAILRAAELIDEEGRWSGGESIFVQTGDLLDRGVGVRAVMDLLMALEPQAAAAGGRIVGLLGNHEVMNMVGVRRDVAMQGQSPGPVYATFADSDSKRRQREAADAWKRWQARFPDCAPGSRREWLAAHPEGYVEYATAFTAEGAYGRWLRERSAVARVGGSIFAHGGLSPELAASGKGGSIEAINDAVAAELARWDEDFAFLVEAGVALEFSELTEVSCALEQVLAPSAADPGSGADRERFAEIDSRFPSPSGWLSFSGDGPLWFRGYAKWGDEKSGSVDRLLAAYGAERLVAGHTPQPGTVASRFGGKVFLIDTAVVYGAEAKGRPAALELIDGRASAIYLDGTVRLDIDESTPDAGSPTVEAVPFRWLGEEGEALPFDDAEAVRQFLSTAEIVSIRALPDGVTKPRRMAMESGGVRARAVFRYVHIESLRKRLSSGEFVMYFRDSYVNEVAAYELAALFGLDNIPPVVLREVSGQEGSVQAWLEHSMRETDRRQRGLKPPNQRYYNNQFYQMRVFDNLIHNIDRNQGNFLFDENWKLWMIDHTRAFAREKKKLWAPDEVIGLTPELWRRLQEVKDEEIVAALDAYLPGPELRALLARRELLVELIRRRIAERGEGRVLFDLDPAKPEVVVTIEEPPPLPEADVETGAEAQAGGEAEDSEDVN